MTASTPGFAASPGAAAPKTSGGASLKFDFGAL
jgi:hypothetical protein